MFVSSSAENLRYDQFCASIRSLFGGEINNQDLKAVYRKISTNPDAKVDWSEVRRMSVCMRERGRKTERERERERRRRQWENEFFGNGGKETENPKWGVGVREKIRE